MSTQGEWVFTDPRFESMRIVCRGRCTFNIYVHSETPLPGYTDHEEGGWYNTDCFTHNQDESKYEVDYDFALQAASEHFDYMWAEHRGECDEGLVLGDDLGKDAGHFSRASTASVVCQRCETGWSLTGKETRYRDAVLDDIVKVLCDCGEDLSRLVKMALGTKS